MRLETPINHKRVAWLMRENDLNSRVRLQRFKHCRLEPKIPDSRPCIDKLNREFFPKEPRKKLVTDMTFFHVEEGWLVLSTIKDLCTKEIIAWGFDTGTIRDLAETTLSKLAGLGPALLHSDQGTVYTALRYRDPEFPIYLYIAGFRRQFSSPSRSKTSLWRPKISPSQTFPVDEL